MRVSIVHDTAGNITGLIAVPPDSPMAYLDTSPGERISEMDVPELDTEMDEQAIGARLTDIAESYLVETGGRPTLKQKG